PRGGDHGVEKGARTRARQRALPDESPAARAGASGRTGRRRGCLATLKELAVAAVATACGTEACAVADLSGGEHDVDGALGRPGDQIVGEVRRRPAPEALGADLPPGVDGDELARPVVELRVLVLVAAL